MKQEPTLPAHVTIEQIERHLDRVALEIAHNPDGKEILPIYEWLERQLEVRKKTAATIDSAMARVAALKKKRA